MTKTTFFVKAVWDSEAKVFVSESDIVGLHIEAESLEAFDRIVGEEAPGLIEANHFQPSEPSAASLADRIPMIFVRPPEPAFAAE